jgi:type IV secretory pathway VirB9-like protein
MISTNSLSQKLALLATAGLFGLCSAGFAAVPAANPKFNAPLESPLDSRIRYYAYTQDMVYDLTIKAGDQHTHIKLDPDEFITEKPKMGDTTQWRVTGNEKNLYIKAFVPGLATSLSLVTSKRVYQFQFRSSDSVRDTVQMVYFMYPDDEEKFVMQRRQAESSAKLAETAKQEKDSRTLLPPLGLDVSNLTVYELTGDLPFKVRTMFADNKFTYLEVPPNTQDLPAIFITNAENKAVPVNYAVNGGWIIIERVEPVFEMRLGTMKLVAKAVKKDGK